MALTKRLSRIGNSAGLIFDRPILKQVGWELNTEVEIRVDGEQLILTRHRYATPRELAASAERVGQRHRKSFDKLGR